MQNHFTILGIGLDYAGNGLKDFMATCRPGLGARFQNARPIKDILPGCNLRRIAPSGRGMLAAAAQALQYAGLAVPLTDEKSGKTGIFMGSALGSAGTSFSYMDTILDGGAQLASPALFSHSVNNVFCGQISMLFNIQGVSSTVCQFGLSFAGALQTAVCALNAGDIDYALVGAVEEASDKATLTQRITGTSYLTPSGDCAVFFVLSSRKNQPCITLSAPEWAMQCDSGSGVLYTGRHNGESVPISRDTYAGTGPEQALDIAAAYALLTSSDAPTQPITIHCEDTDHALAATIQVSRHD